MRNSARRPLCMLIVGSALMLGACSHDRPLSADAAAGSDDPINIPPANYKSDILGAMHAYLNDPTGIRDAGIAEPALKSVGNATRYVVCLRFNAKKHGKEYAGAKEVAAVFVAGRFDRFADPAKEACAGAIYMPFPALEKLSR
jgi:hypothetical protein